MKSPQQMMTEATAVMGDLWIEPVQELLKQCTIPLPSAHSAPLNANAERLVGDIVGALRKGPLTLMNLWEKVGGYHDDFEAARIHCLITKKVKRVRINRQHVYMITKTV